MSTPTIHSTIEALEEMLQRAKAREAKATQPHVRKAIARDATHLAAAVNGLRLLADDQETR